MMVIVNSTPLRRLGSSISLNVANVNFAKLVYCQYTMGRNMSIRRLRSMIERASIMDDYGVRSMIDLAMRDRLSTIPLSKIRLCDDK